MEIEATEVGTNAYESFNQTYEKEDETAERGFASNVLKEDVNALASSIFTKESLVSIKAPSEIVIQRPPLLTGAVSYPFTYQNNSGKSADDIYIQIIGTDPITGFQCYIMYDKEGNPSYVDGKAGLQGTDYSYPLSYFPESPDGKGYTLNLPLLNGGRVYTSIDRKMPSSAVWAPKIQQYLIVPDLSTSLVMDKTEFTINAGDLYINPTAVDDFSLPISVEETSKNGEVQKGGISTVSREKIFSDMASELSKAGAPWETLITKVPPQIHSPVNAALIGIFPQDYFQKAGFFEAFGKVFSANPLLVNAGESFPNTGVFKGIYDEATGEMTLTGNFQGNDISVVLKIPNTTSDLLTGSGPSWNVLPTDPLIIQALKSALARNIATAIETNTLTTVEALDKAYFIKNQKNFYIENPEMEKLGGPQFIDHYSKVLHGFVRDIYTYGYDDEAGQSGGCTLPPKNFGSGMIILGPLQES